MAPKADIRVSLPAPLPSEGTEQFAKRAMQELTHFRSCLLTGGGQRLFITIARQQFNAKANFAHFRAFVDLLAETLPPPLEPLFDFSAAELDVASELPLLQCLNQLRPRLPGMYICYHHVFLHI